MNDLVVLLLALWLYGLSFIVLISALPNHRNGIRMYLAAMSWALGAVLATICGLAILLAAQVGQFAEITYRNHTAIIGAIFLALCASVVFFAYYLFGAP